MSLTAEVVAGNTHCFRILIFFLDDYTYISSVERQKVLTNSHYHIQLDPLPSMLMTYIHTKISLHKNILLIMYILNGRTLNYYIKIAHNQTVMTGYKYTNREMLSNNTQKWSTYDVIQHV